jgi:hypothetical protein
MQASNYDQNSFSSSHGLWSADELPTKERLKLHDGLQNVESSLLIQMRTGKISIGLRAFLFERQVPDVQSVCSGKRRGIRELPFAIHTHRDFDTAITRIPGQPV